MIHLSSLAHICCPDVIRRAEAALTCRDLINFVFFLNETAGPKRAFHVYTYIVDFSSVSGLACLTSLMFG